MRCEYCPFLVYDYSEDCEICPLGDDLAEYNNKNEAGCKYTGKQLKKLIEEDHKQQNEAFWADCKSFNEFMDKEELKTKPKDCNDR